MLVLDGVMIPVVWLPLSLMPRRTPEAVLPAFVGMQRKAAAVAAGGSAAVAAAAASAVAAAAEAGPLQRQARR